MGAAGNHRRTAARAGAATAAAGCLLLAVPAAGQAAPAGTGFTCRASAARVELTGLAPVEPFVANPGDEPCAVDDKALAAHQTYGPVTLNALDASSVQDPTSLATRPLVNDEGATAQAAVTNPRVGVAGVTAAAQVLTSRAAYTCRSGQPVPTSTSSVVGLSANGNTVPAGSTPQTVNLGPLGTLALNKTIKSPGRITQQALALTTPAGSVVIGESSVGVQGNPCAAAAAAPSTPAARARTGRARLSGRCVDGRYLAIVTGRHIRSVTFRVAGKRARTRTRAPFSVPVSGRHRVSAAVRFTRASNTGTRTLRTTSRACPSTVRFTG